MEKSGWVSALGTWFGNILLLISLVFIWFQIKGVKEQLKSAAFQGIWNIWIEIDKWFVANPTLKPYFYHGKDLDQDLRSEEEKEEMRMRLESTAEMFMDCFANFYHQRSCMLPHEEEAYKRFMRSVYANQPFFRKFVDNSKDWYYPRFIEYLSIEYVSKEIQKASDVHAQSDDSA